MATKDCFKMNTIRGIKIYLLVLFSWSESTIDINVAEYRYLTNHLTVQDCRKLVAALHFRGYDLPKGLNAAERKLPRDVDCIDLLLHWNSSPREGRGQTHIEVCHRLNQIGRKDLAEWLSKTVFHELSKDVINSLNSCVKEETTTQTYNFTMAYEDEEEILDEAPWCQMDTVISILLVFGLITLVIGAFFLCYLCVTKKRFKTKGYEKLPATEY